MYCACAIFNADFETWSIVILNRAFGIVILNQVQEYFLISVGFFFHVDVMKSKYVSR